MNKINFIKDLFAGLMNILTEDWDSMKDNLPVDSFLFYYTRFSLTDYFEYEFYKSNYEKNCYMAPAQNILKST